MHFLETCNIHEVEDDASVVCTASNADGPQPTLVQRMYLQARSCPVYAVAADHVTVYTNHSQDTVNLPLLKTQAISS
jgi:hypothetical protein